MSRLAFLGTPAAAVPTLQRLSQSIHEVAIVVSRPDRRRGRGGTVSASPVKRAALDLGLPVTDRLDDVLNVDAQLGIVVAYGRLIPEHVLSRLPMINVHFSLLPRWRGAAPVERALLAGDETTGVAVMGLEAGLDTGPVFTCREIAIEPEESAEELRARLALIGADLVLDLLRDGVEGLPSPAPQVGAPTYAEKIATQELQLNWETTAQELWQRIRIGRAWTTWRGRRLRLLRALPPSNGGKSLRANEPPGAIVGNEVATGSGPLAILEVQPESGRAMSWEDWIRGARPRPGERLGS